VVISKRRSDASTRSASAWLRTKVFCAEIPSAELVTSHRSLAETFAHAETVESAVLQEGDSVIIDVDADGQVSVLNGDKKMTQMISETPAGIS